MSFYANIGYQFKLPNRSGTDLVPDGSIILGSSMPFHQLERRRIDKRFPHMNRHLFDPQLYLAGLDANQSPKHCAKLASYPWFGVKGLNEYISSQQNQSKWMNHAEKNIAQFWTRKAPSDVSFIEQSVEECIDFQIRWGCHSVILPSPLTHDPSSAYDFELTWLDSGLDYIQHHNIKVPIFATVALSDICVNYSDPLDNNLLQLILDVISAREVDGVYIVLEQGQEPSETRQCSSTRALRSILHLVHVFNKDSNLRIAVNFLGQFGLACEAAGAELWASNWYKSEYRLRLADKMAGGRAYPSYWSHNAALDIHLSQDFDRLNKAGLLAQIADRTDASVGLLHAASRAAKCETVPNWQYRINNVTSSREHFLRSSSEAESTHSSFEGKERLDFVERWLKQAVTLANRIESKLTENRQTNTTHVQSWLDAFLGYRADHDI